NTLSGLETTRSFTGEGYGFSYAGRFGSTGNSAFVFGYSSEVNLVDWHLSPYHTGTTTYPIVGLENKSGRYNVLLDQGTLSSNQTEWESLEVLKLYLSGTTVGSKI